VVASLKYVNYNPPESGGRHSMLFARDVSETYPIRPQQDVLALANVVEPIPVHPPKLPEAKNWKELIQIVGQEASLSAYNVVVADPTFEVYSLSTRLRFYHDGPGPVTVEIDVEVSL
jgi:hypothetical protein